MGDGFASWQKKNANNDVFRQVLNALHAPH